MEKNFKYLKMRDLQTGIKKIPRMANICTQSSLAVSEKF